MVQGAAMEDAADSLRHGFTIGDIRVDPRAFVLSNEDGANASVSDSAMRLLLHLAENQGRNVSMPELNAALGSECPDSHLDETIRELHDALVDELGRPGSIELSEHSMRLTSQVELAGRGHFSGLIALVNEIRKRRVFRVATAYALIAFIVLQVADAMIDTLPIGDEFFPVMLAVMAIGFPVVVLMGWFFETTPQGIFLDRRKTSGLMSRTAAMTGLVFLIGIAIGFAFALFNLTDFEKTTEAPEDVAIAVLPFDNMSGNPADQDISDGIVEELLIELSRVKELRVVGRKASFYYRDREEEWETIVDKLGANMIIEGSIRRNNGTVRVAAQLIDRAGMHIWGDSYDAPIDKVLDTLAVQRNIARRVAGALPIQLSEESRQLLERLPTANEQAYQLYLQGRKYLRDADRMDDFQSAEILFRDALDVDPDFTGALSGLCETQLLIYQDSLRPQDYARATVSCSRLITADQLNAEGYVAVGTLNRLSGSNAEAESLFQDALELSPGHEPALYGLARSIEGQGRYAEAEQYYRESELADPGFWQVYIGYGGYLERGGRYTEAIEKYQQVIRLAPDNFEGFTNLGAVYFDSDQWSEAAQAWRAAVELQTDPISLMNIGTVEYYLGNMTAAESYFREGIASSAEFYPLWGKLGAVLERQGRPAESQAAYSEAVDYAAAVLEINANDSRTMSYLGSYHAHLGNFAEAAKWSANAVELSPRNPAVHYFAAVVASLAGEPDAATDALADALRLGYSVRIIRQDSYFQPYLDSAKLVEWMSEE